MSDERKALGKRGEDAAVAYLERAGLTVIERNWRGRTGEVDVIAIDGPALVLCEVKTRRSVRRGTPEEAVTEAKQRKYARLAAEYLQKAGLTETEVRFDVISILVLEEHRALLRHHRAAFTLEEGA